MKTLFLVLTDLFIRFSVYPVQSIVEQLKFEAINHNSILERILLARKSSLNTVVAVTANMSAGTSRELCAVHKTRH